MNIRDRLRFATNNYYFGDTFAPYLVDSGVLTRGELKNWCKSVNEYQAKLGLVNPFSVYETLLDELGNRARYHVAPLQRFEADATPDKVSVGLRHDVDADVCTGVRAAKELKRRGLEGTFFLLHTSYYYGYFDQGVFRRQPALEEILDEYVITGSEVGLHNDALGIYLDHGIDGRMALETELAWIGKRFRVLGTTAHNSANLYGAENFEICPC